MESQLGTIEKDKVADLVLLDSNPLDDIRNTQKIAGVVANGRYFSRQDLDKLLAGRIVEHHELKSWGADGDAAKP